VIDTVSKIVSIPIQTYDSSKRKYVKKLAFYSYAKNKLSYLGAVTNDSSINRAVLMGKYIFAIKSNGITTYTIPRIKKVSALTLK
jgi:hypothetical protein